MASPIDLSTTIGLTLNATASKAGSLVTPSGVFSPSKTLTMADGSGAGQSDMIYTATGTLTDAATVTITLLGGTEKSLMGDLLNFAKITAILIKNRAAIGKAGIDFTEGAANGWYGCFVATTHGVKVAATGAEDGDMFGFMWLDPNGVVVDGTHKTLLLTHDHVDTESVIYEIWIIGIST